MFVRKICKKILTSCFKSPIKNRPLSDLSLGHCLSMSDLGPSIWKRTKNVATRHDVSIINFWNNKNIFFSHTNILSDLDIRIVFFIGKKRWEQNYLFRDEIFTYMNLTKEIKIGSYNYKRFYLLLYRILNIWRKKIDWNQFYAAKNSYP
jgi:hypothetical protein